MSSLPVEPPLPRVSPGLSQRPSLPYLHNDQPLNLPLRISDQSSTTIRYRQRIEVERTKERQGRKREKEREKEREDKAGSFVFINAIKRKSGSEDECRERREFSSLREINLVPTLCFCCGEELSDAPHGGSSHPNTSPDKRQN